MKVFLFSDFLPTVDNYRGPSALPFYILKGLVGDNELMVMTTNANKVPQDLILKSERSLGIEYCISPRNIFMNLLTSRKTGLFFTPFLGNKYGYLSRYRLSNKEIKIINDFNPDLVLIYPYHLIKVVEQLSSYSPIVIGPDCAFLGRIRSLMDSFSFCNNQEKEIVHSIEKTIDLEQDLSKLNCKIALVGREDCRVFNTCTSSEKAFFLPHPHYGLKDKVISFSSDVLKVVITGGYDYATFSDINKMVDAFKVGFKNKRDYLFTFIGKSWGPVVEKLKDVCNIDHKVWVEDYSEELIKHDIQVIPISNGVGTKGKTLDAMANGLLCIGSYYAFENISAEDGIDYVQYETVDDLPNILLSINDNRFYYQSIAVSGRITVRNNHVHHVSANYLLNFANAK